MKRYYQKRLVAYIDLLGFSELVENTTTIGNREIPDAVHHILLLYKRLKRTFKPQYHTVFWNPKTSKQVTAFSDSIVISFDLRDLHLLGEITAELYQMLQELIWNGSICRGGIAIGHLHHTPTAVVGPALIEAYSIEKSRAVVPRVVVAKEVVDLAAKWKPDYSKTNVVPEFEEMFAMDKDGESYIDYFSIHSVNPPMVNDDGWYFLKRLRRIIVSGLHWATASSQQRVLEKYLWMADKYNARIELYNSKSFWSTYYVENAFNLERPRIRLCKIDYDRIASRVKVYFVRRD